jgi:hypothetical protein
VKWKVRLVADPELRCCRFRHPGRQAGECPIGLDNDDELDAAGFEPPLDLHHFAEARVEPVADTGLSHLFAGTM